MLFSIDFDVLYVTLDDGNKCLSIVWLEDIVTKACFENVANIEALTNSFDKNVFYPSLFSLVLGEFATNLRAYLYELV